MPPPSEPLLVRRPPKRLLFAFMGEYLFQARREWMRTRAFIHAFEGAGVKPQATRAVLERGVQQGYLSRQRTGREAEYALTERAERIIAGSRVRVRGAHPFTPEGDGWTLVIFSLAEESQPTRYRVRAALTWEGFAPFGRGAWIAPGEANLDALRAAMARVVQGERVVAFHAHDVEGLRMTDAAAQKVWDVARIAEAHAQFERAWGSAAEERLAGVSPLSLHTMLIADWVRLLRHDPRLPPQFLPASWPADASQQLFDEWSDRLALPAKRELLSLLGEGGRP